MSERISNSPHVPPTDADVISTLVDLSHRLYDPYYIPPYKTGEAFVDHFVNEEGDGKKEQFRFVPDQRDLYLALKNTPTTHLGANYDYLLYEKEKRAGNMHGRWGTPERFYGMKNGVEQIIESLSAHVAKLEEDPTYKYIAPLSTYTARTRHEAEAALQQANFGEHLKRDRYMDDNLEDIRQLVARQMLLKALGFNLHGDNTIVRSPNFVGRIETEEENAIRIVELWWGWGHPHIFYAKDVTEIQGDNPHVVLSEQLVVASVRDIAKNFMLLHTEPQDMKIQYPADPQPVSEMDREDLTEFIKDLATILSDEPAEDDASE